MTYDRMGCRHVRQAGGVSVRVCYCIGVQMSVLADRFQWGKHYWFVGPHQGHWTPRFMFCSVNIVVFTCCNVGGWGGPVQIQGEVVVAVDSPCCASTGHMQQPSPVMPCVHVYNMLVGQHVCLCLVTKPCMGYQPVALTLLFAHDCVCGPCGRISDVRLIILVDV
jgi:hypothetical protein